MQNMEWGPKTARAEEPRLRWTFDLGSGHRGETRQEAPGGAPVSEMLLWVQALQPPVSQGKK